MSIRPFLIIEKEQISLKSQGKLPTFLRLGAFVSVIESYLL